MSFDVFPSEILKLIISFLCKKDAKNVALTSKRMYDLALDRIWYKIKPKLLHIQELWEQQDSISFEKFSHLPIREMSVWYFPKWSCKNVQKALPQLKLLHFDESTVKKMRFDSEYFNQFKMPMVINTGLFEMFTQSDFDKLLYVIKTCNVVKLLINHECHPVFYTNQLRLSPSQVEMFIDEIPKIELSLQCLAFTQDNVEEFSKILSRNKNYEIRLSHFKNYYYSFTAKDIELMARYDIKLTELTSHYLRMLPFDDDHSLRNFAVALTKLKHLKLFFIWHRKVPKLIEHFINVPITKLGTYAFDISAKNKIDKAVKTLSQIKSLRRLVINPCDYQFLPEDLAKFNGLPVKSIYLAALHLTFKNFVEL